MTNICILYPSGFGNINKIDDDYDFEREIAEEKGLPYVSVLL